MSVYKPASSPYYQYDFRRGGRRFTGSTKETNRRAAQAVERRLQEQAAEDRKRLSATAGAPPTFDDAAGRYWREVGQYWTKSKAYHAVIARLVDHFGRTRLDQIDHAAVAELVAKRRREPRWGKTKLKHGTVRPICNTTVNSHVLKPLKTIFRRAVLVWGCHLPREPVWGKIWLKQPEEIIRELDANEEAALERAVRDDYKPWFHFTHLSARRLAETLIGWPDVNWAANEIVTRGKGGRIVRTPITPSIRKILEGERGRHPEFVFTYVAERNMPRYGIVKGRRYPITYRGVVTRWRRDLAKSGVENFWLHGLRHDRATKVLRKTGNLKLVQRVLNHAQISTTARYAHVTDEDVLQALERSAEPRTTSGEKSRKTSRRSPDDPD